ncbi:transcriptional regulator, AraC family protein [Streptomyces bingchenggensis BCW-1]|uniref:Transcriptional regulator, AraC family protein n=1 Tax=Streptomyces bingchenggensis (strain BCW-1) TaxID=749414 RepID=D7C3P3_STRBB|nr:MULTISPECIES: AraC family transcriptional regulator [Streptomyces]ADI12259.1 transcriptional regulator, AraC family protein [Streptomyces bingchenggensis BCW-1]
MGTERSWVRYWRDGSYPLEAMHAHFFDHVYAPHSHDTYSFGITDIGAQRFHCRGAAYTSGAGMVMAFNPDDVHDGRAAAELGYQYRIVHIGPALVRDVLTDAAGKGAAAMPLFGQPVLHDPALIGALSRLHTVLSGPADPGVRDECLTAAVLAMARRGATRAPRLRTESASAQRQIARRALALLRESCLEPSLAPLPADALAEAIGCSRYTLYRAFRAEYGLAPSAYQRQLRLRRARDLMTTGISPAAAAAATGFADQAHFTRWFHRAYGLTPGTFRRALGVG